MILPPHLLLVPFDEEMVSTEDEEPMWDMSTGHLEIYVTLNDKPGTRDNTFEFDVLDYSGCVDWMEEGIGISFFLTDMSGLVPEMRAGRRYVIRDIEVHFTRGDGWTIDDDEDWDFGEVEEHTFVPQFVWQTISNAWWVTVGWRISRGLDPYRPRFRRLLTQPVHYLRGQRKNNPMKRETLHRRAFFWPFNRR